MPATGGLVNLRGTFHIQIFVWALVVEDLNKYVEAGRQAAILKKRSNTGRAWQDIKHASKVAAL